MQLTNNWIMDDRFNEYKKQIDKMTYYDLLKLWRFGSDDLDIFQGKVGRYFAVIMAEKKQVLTHEERVSTSKSIGWDLRN